MAFRSAFRLQDWYEYQVLLTVQCTDPVYQQVGLVDRFVVLSGTIKSEYAKSALAKSLKMPQIPC